MYGTVNFNVIDTTPGAETAFAPPPDFQGDYREFMIRRMNTDIGVHQHVGIVARKIYLGKQPPEFIGVYAQIARQLAEHVSRKLQAASMAYKATVKAD